MRANPTHNISKGRYSMSAKDIIVQVLHFDIDTVDVS